ncbi:MAG: hypothetical protein ACHP7K_04760 [Actinomycetales bacterium]
MTEIHYVNTVKAAQDNLEEANRQLDQAVKDHAAGLITEQRLAQLKELRDISVADLARVMREN